jgi:hypothetical protein
MDLKSILKRYSVHHKIMIIIFKTWNFESKLDVHREHGNIN